jgi:hypothetical protein
MSVEQFHGRSGSGRTTPRRRFRCTACSYGASREAAPERCPMCGGSEWDFEDWRPFSSLTADLAPRQSTPKAAP